MIWHPSMMSILLMDGITLLLLNVSATARIQLLLNWSPASASSAQIQLERKLEKAEALQPAAFGIHAAASLLWVVGIANILPTFVPGAMCGTGVMQAAEGAGGRALAFRGLALLILHIAGVLGRMNHRDPNAALSIPHARASLLALPFTILGTLYTFKTILGMTVPQPVDCCAIVYDAIQETIAAGGGQIFSNSALVSVMILGWLLICSAGIWISIHPSSSARIPVALLAFAAFGFLFSGAAALVRVFSPYFYHVLHHHCPWCFFLPEHHYVGFPLFTALLAVAAEGGVPLIAVCVSRRHGGIESAINRRIKRSALWVSSCATLFVLMTAMPAVLWRIRHGVWMTG